LAAAAAIAGSVLAPLVIDVDEETDENVGAVSRAPHWTQNLASALASPPH